MRFNWIKRPEGKALRVELRPFSARLRLLMVVAGGAIALFYPWRWGFGLDSVSPSVWGLSAAALAFSVLCMAGALATNIIQLELDRRIRKGWRILGIPVWLGSVSLSRVSALKLDTSDPTDLILKCLDPAGNSVLAIEGFRSPDEAGYLASQLVKGFDPDDLVVQEFVEDLRSIPSTDARRSIRWTSCGICLLFGMAMAFMNPGGTLVDQIVTTGIVMMVAIFGMAIALPNDRIVSSDAVEGVVEGWYRRRFFWIDDYILDLRNNPHPIVTRTRIDRWIPTMGVVLIVYGGAVIALVSHHSPRHGSGEEVGDTEKEERLRELSREGAELYRDYLRERESEKEAER